MLIKSLFSPRLGISRKSWPISPPLRTPTIPPAPILLQLTGIHAKGLNLIRCSSWRASVPGHPALSTSEEEEEAYSCSAENEGDENEVVVHNAVGETVVLAVAVTVAAAARGGVAC